jgi:RNA polymerase sigma factor (sigma-70 family)
VAALASPSRLRRRGTADHELVARIRRGDELAFGVVHARYRVPLERYALRLVGSQAAAEDVVQDAFIRAHGALLRDEREIELKPWLYRVVRNRALDELRRPGAGEQVALEAVGERAQPEALADPATVTERRQALREVVADIAALPERQREVLLRRELDGTPHEQLAAELGITVPASKKLVNRARENLVKAAEARSGDCVDVRRDLLRAHDRRRRASARTYRHLTGCEDCRGYRAALGSTRSGIQVLGPFPLLGAAIALAKGAAGALLPGGGGLAAKAATATAVTAAVAGGAYGLSQVVTGPGQPSPMTVRSAVFFGGVVYGGDRMPSGTALVRRTVRLAPGTRRHPAATLRCPSGTRVAGLTPHRGADVGHGYGAATIVGSSRVAEVVFEPRALPQGGAITVGTVCKRPNAAGSVLAAPVFFAAGSRVNRVCARRAYLYETPSGLVVGTVFRGQPVERVRQTANRRWWRIRTDAGTVGWVRRSAICR